MPNKTKESLSHLGMVFETPGGLAGSEVPQTQGLVPRARESVVAVAGQDHVADEVRVAVQTLLGDSVVGLVPGQFPYDEGLVWNTETCVKSQVLRVILGWKSFNRNQPHIRLPLRYRVAIV